MNKLELSGHFVDLSMEELVSLDGGASWVVELSYWAGRVIGQVAKVQAQMGDSGQWLA